MKYCVSCKKWKRLSSYYKTSKGHHQRRCKVCNRLLNKKWARKNRNKKINYQAVWREKNKLTPRYTASKILENMKRLHRNKKFNYPVEFSLDDIENIVKKGKCCKTGIKFERKTKGSAYAYPFSASPDRVDNLKGYTRDNVQWVVYIYNIMKKDFSEEVLKKFIKRLK